MNRTRAEQLLNPARSILVVGEMMLDEFIWGKVSRISPEAPVPIVEVQRQTFNAGGAANAGKSGHYRDGLLLPLPVMLVAEPAERDERQQPG